ncbi:MAG: Rieske 2Fe-2S domain-containing protein [Candidatus Latescibacterota bacterium]|nr:MAG: Rieske 2Fe-2S domain-containing protein [Candidatus Latescibacterota bacterium]
MSAPDNLITFGHKLEPKDPLSIEPDWMQARLPWIEKALEHALRLPSGGWYVLAASREIGKNPRRYRVNSEDYVAWRDGGRLVVAPDACPHMGACLSDGKVREGSVVCPWHGLELGGERHGAWEPVTSYDDGVLSWVRPGPEQDGVTRPVIPQRPSRFLDAVMRKEANCEPTDIIANRLDPWHGVHFHPHSFARLKIIDQTEDAITARVVYRVFGRLGIEVDARFHCPEPRTIVMTIVAGEGAGSVVETHATPIDPARTTVIEATLATSERPQFQAVVGALGGLLRPLVRWRAHKLWVEDAAYAERRYELRRTRR